MLKKSWENPYMTLYIRSLQLSQSCKYCRPSYVVTPGSSRAHFMLILKIKEYQFMTEYMFQFLIYQSHEM